MHSVAFGIDLNHCSKPFFHIVYKVARMGQEFLNFFERKKMSQNQGNNFQDFVSHFSTVITRLIWQENGTFLERKKISIFFAREKFLSLQKYKIKFLFRKKRLKFFFFEKTKIFNHSCYFGSNVIRSIF